VRTFYHWPPLLQQLAETLFLSKKVVVKKSIIDNYWEKLSFACGPLKINSVAFG